ncbi:VWA domain-containing protein [Bacillus sp. 2205SS5-2]|uniref:VWA domain-containing protein n=1 Tax=Bacillus sp. 2205SS5-2 TaxID=3109031 RepID=UPI003003CC56
MSTRFKIIRYPALIFFFVLFSTSFASAAQSPSIDFTVNPSQDVLLKPQDANAEGRLDFSLTPKGDAPTTRDPVDTLFIMDTSGSMKEVVANSNLLDKTRLGSAKQALNEAVTYFKGQNSQDQFGLVPFSDNVNSNNVVTLSNDSFRDNAAKLDYIQTRATTFVAAGGTNYTSTFNQALQLFSENNHDKNVIFLTDGQATHSQSTELVTYEKKEKIGKECYRTWWGGKICYPIYEEAEVTEEMVVYYNASVYLNSGKIANPKLSTTKSGNNGYFRRDGQVISLGNIDATSYIQLIKGNDISTVKQLSAKGVKVYSIAFGDGLLDQHKQYLKDLSDATGADAIAASDKEDLSSVFMKISEQISAPKINAEIKIDISKYKGKVVLPSGSTVRQEGDNLYLNHTFTYEIDKGTPSPKDLTLPLEFTEKGTYTFDNIQLTYDGLATPIRKSATIIVKDNAPASLIGEMNVKGIANPLHNLIKEETNIKSNQFNVHYTISPGMIVNAKGVNGALNSLSIVQPLPTGVKIVESLNVTQTTQDGKNVAIIKVLQTLPYTDGQFTTNGFEVDLLLQTDWAINNVSMPSAKVDYADSRFTETSYATIPSSGNRISSKVRLNTIEGSTLIAYDGYAGGIIKKVDKTKKQELATTAFPNPFDLKELPVKDINFKSGSNNTAIDVTYSTGETVTMYFTPDFSMKEKGSGVNLFHGDHTLADVVVKLSKLIAGNDLNYFYRTETVEGWTDWSPLTAEESVTLTKIGENTIEMRAEGGFSLSELTISKSVFIDKWIESITVTPNPIEVLEGQSLAFLVDIQPLDATNHALSISIEDTSIASVRGDKDQVVGLKVGQTNLIIQTQDGSGIVVKVPIKVLSPYVKLEEIQFTKERFVLTLSENPIELNSLIKYYPENATNKTITNVVASDAKMVSIFEENGIWYAKALKIGPVTITAVAEEYDQVEGDIEDNAIFNFESDDDGGTGNETGNLDGRW